ncbi:MAG: shikimate kinase [Chitinophagales bacterium]|nr:shikimate kinase [Chitinophagales bacterium]
MKPLFLVGFMGAGKTYRGQRLAAALDRSFLDMDEEIVRQSGKTIPEIFAESGEAGFREIERRVLHSEAVLRAGVVATGGGLPCFFDNMDWMKAQGQVIWLNVPPAILAERLRPEKAKRPLLAEVPDEALESFIEKLLEQRRPYYERANLVLTI